MIFRSKLYITLQTFTICLGVFNFGFNLGVFNTIGTSIRKLNGWEDKNEWALYNGIITSAYPLGGTLGPFLVPFIL